MPKKLKKNKKLSGTRQNRQAPMIHNVEAEVLPQSLSILKQRSTQKAAPTKPGASMPALNIIPELKVIGLVAGTILIAIFVIYFILG